MQYYIQFFLPLLNIKNYTAIPVSVYVEHFSEFDYEEIKEK